ncbi:adenylate/guanylate cyclase domain-containing protein [[Phormidium] sp. LEGE 05292]|uniref:adenylate/guanylate cyclase domain-containing protein n=1 Tax=[Phormidium] sp. LEGE 05292 TaxID=767427 RepID=UPI001D1475F1|nr:adenylate/guanylate cyclase domain-containing protein [Phormidium sp. LEGE 05292]
MEKNMIQISLKKLLLKKEFSVILSNINQALGAPISIQDRGGNLLWGEVSNSEFNKYPVTVEKEIIGWVVGDEKASTIAQLLSYLANEELQKKILARETLDKYKEINLLYNISEKFTACLVLKEVAKLAIEEATKIIKSTSASAMLLSEKTGNLEIIAACGKEYHHKTILLPGEGIAGNIFLTGIAEIVNDVESDPRFVRGANQVKSLICAPLKTQDAVLGILTISNEELVNYTAHDLKLFTAVASQAASAIENALLHENKLKEERIKSNLERYIPAQVVQAILHSKGYISLAPANKNISILFSDIRNFTTKCEELAPEAIVEYLNEYLTNMVEVIFEQGGTVNKFVGDMIVAMFGAPSTLVDNERRAIETAIRMQNRIKNISVPWIRKNFITGIGLSSGEVVVGNIGSPQHMDYTAIGDKVNIASRLQSIAKGEQILITQSIYEATENLFEFKEFGTIQLKGKKEAIKVFEVVY